MPFGKTRDLAGKVSTGSRQGDHFDGFALPPASVPSGLDSVDLDQALLPEEGEIVFQTGGPIVVNQFGQIACRDHAEPANIGQEFQCFVAQ